MRRSGPSCRAEGAKRAPEMQPRPARHSEPATRAEQYRSCARWLVCRTVQTMQYKLMEEAEFDRFADEYETQHRKNIAVTGESPDFFAEYKIRQLATFVPDLLAAS